LRNPDRRTPATRPRPHLEQRLVDRRIRMLLLALLVAFGAALARAAWLQTVRADPLAAMARTQSRQAVTLPAGRGAIYDRRGTALALGIRATTVYANPRLVREPRTLAVAAARTLGVDANAVYERVRDRSRSFVYIARKVDADRADRLAKEALPGVGFYAEERRTYPQRSLASHVLGYAGVDNTGLAGLEAALDDTLSGKAGSATTVKDPTGRVLNILNARDPKDGADVRLTIDSRLQANAEDVLSRTVRKWRAKSATAITLDVRTGHVLAMAVLPRFDANRFAETAAARTRNRSVTDTYEPGSTFKIVTVAGALSERLVSPRTIFTVPYSVRVADRVIRESHWRPTQRMMVAEILSRSSNVGTIKIAQKLEERGLARWMQRFGFGRPTGIDFPGETRGIVPPVSAWSGSTIGNVPIGQGIAVTPIQMAAAYAALANRGVWTRPHLVDQEHEPNHPDAERRVVSRAVAAKMAEMLHAVVDSGGTGTAAALPGFHVAGKTGTAAKATRRGYSSSRYVASFVGFVPATAPRFAILVTVDEPRGDIFGGTVAAPAFQAIADFALRTFDIPPDDRRKS
jgi:cell division protein FtsI (penicillin-binding protein 3)